MSSIDLVVWSECEVTIQGMVQREEAVVMHLTGSRFVESLEIDSWRELARLVIQIKGYAPTAWG